MEFTLRTVTQSRKLCWNRFLPWWYLYKLKQHWQKWMDCSGDFVGRW